MGGAQRNPRLRNERTNPSLGPSALHRVTTPRGQGHPPAPRYRESASTARRIPGHAPAKPELFDPAHLPASPASQPEPLSDAPSTVGASYVAHARGVIARARFTSEIAREAGTTREALYRSDREDGDSRVTTLLGVMCALGVRLTADVAAVR